MGVGKIFSREDTRGFFQNFSSGWVKNSEIWFFPLETKKTSLFCWNFQNPAAQFEQKIFLQQIASCNTGIQVQSKFLILHVDTASMQLSSWNPEFVKCKHFYVFWTTDN